MFKTIFSKLIAVFMAILIIGFSIAGVMMYYFLGDFVSNERVSLLERSGEDINTFLSEYIEYINNPLVLNTFRYLLKSYRISTNSLIWIVDRNGFLVITEYADAESGIPAEVVKKLKDNGDRLRLPDERQYRKVMLGSDPVIERGYFYGLFTDTGMPWVTIQKPLVYQNEIIAAVYLHTPIPEMQRVRYSVFRLFLVSVIISVFISIIFGYMFSLRISRPLKQIKNAAKVIAGGEFKKRLDINTNDEIGELAKSFNQMVVALEHLEEMRRGFIANVSHELRTPMTSIRGFIEGILDGTIPHDKQSYYLSIVRDETNRLNRLVNDLLDLARMEAGEVSLTYRDFDINELIRICIIKLESFIMEKDIQIEANFYQEETLVNADSDAIERVLYNLIHNAIKFTPEKGKIAISTNIQKARVLVSIEDSGAGMEKDELGLIWDRFYKSDKSRSKDKAGTGLGLAIAKNIIVEHGQEIWVESEPGEGAKFTFTLAANTAQS
jgi:signal transduction histidine kinase